MTTPGLNVFITTYNSEIYVWEAVNSILNQTYTDFELIIIDNCSIVKSFEDKRIEIVSQPQNMGIAGSRNRALEMANSEFIAFLDSDDIAHPQKLEKQIAFLRAHPDFGFVGSSVILIDEKGKETGRWKLNADSEMIPAIMLFHNYFVNSAVMFRRDLIADFRYSEELTIGEDYLMWFHLIQKAKGINLPGYLTSYRQHKDSIIQRTAVKRGEFDKKVYELIFRQIGLLATDQEYEIHLSIKNNEAITSVDQLDKILLWLRKISQHSVNIAVINNKSISKVILNRWLKLCFKARSRPGTLFYGLIKILFNINLFFNCRCRSKKQ